MECSGLISKNLQNPDEKESGEPKSLLEVEEHFFNRLLSRESSKGFSSRMYYREAGKVPFKWEAQPGKPKNTLENMPLPPLSPPPAALSSHLPPLKHQPTKGATRARGWFWKKKGTKVKESQSPSQCQENSGEIFEFWGCEAESTSTWSSPRNSSSSSSSFSSLSSFSATSPSPAAKPSSTKSQMPAKKGLRKRQGMEGQNRIWSSTSWGFSGAMVCMARIV